MIAEALRVDEEPAREEKANILLVDDRPENLVALQAVLQPLGETLVTAESGKDALRQLLKHDFAVILLDAQMPEMDGFETAGLIRQRERNRHTPIIFLTAYSRDRENVSQGYSVGAVDYITKPFDPEILRSKIRVFVELYKRGEDINSNQSLLRESEMREVERLRQEEVLRLEQEHMRRLTQELEARVAERTRELVDANEELQAFCYSVSHDLRAPLRAVNSSSMILLEENDGKLSEEHVALLERQAHNARRLGNLIDDLLQLSRIGRQALDQTTSDMSKLAGDAAQDILSREWEQAPRITIQPGMVAYADSGLIRLLYQNFLDNACKYSPNGACVEVGWTPGQEPVFFVRDHGIGFDMKYAHKIFLPFERLHLDTEFPGTGIGLASVHRIVRKHGGKVWVESAPNEGATFYFTLGESVPSGTPIAL